MVRRSGRSRRVQHCSRLRPRRLGHGQVGGGERLRLSGEARATPYASATDGLGSMRNRNGRTATGDGGGYRVAWRQISSKTVWRSAHSHVDDGVELAHQLDGLFHQLDVTLGGTVIEGTANTDLSCLSSVKRAVAKS